GEPVFGATWQLCYAVHNFRPALQLVRVEQRQADGSWANRQECLTIEFQTRGAQPRGDVVREHAAPVEWDGDRSRPPQLRFALLGVGEVRLVDVVLTDGRRRIPVKLPRAVLGKKAPTRGLPDLDWSKRRDVLPVPV
ncbi:MAG TPA: glycoside hydrolase family 20, partial [Opitutaceae bacterium]|nr:glycoside hydrolase family 20 [Opitutaceae bacterium]